MRGKIGAGPLHATPRLGSLNLDSNELIIVDYDMYPRMEYISSYWKQMKNPYDGDTLCVYIDGPEISNGPQGQSYELETLSPALFLKPGETFTYRNRTFHIFSSKDTVGKICEKFLGPTREEIEIFDQASTP